MNNPDNNLLNKYESLKSYLHDLAGVAIAFSSGVDSAFLLYAANEAYKGDISRVIAVTASASIFPQREFKEATEFCARYGIKHIIKKVNPFVVEGFENNPKNRCYLCKKELFKSIIDTARENGISSVAEGSNLDDNGDYRPGLVAISELGILSPLRVVGFTKNEIRILSEYFGLDTWNKSSFACLASRFPYGEKITEEKLKMVELSEEYLMSMGLAQFRVRIHGDRDYMARIELLPEDISKFMDDSVRISVENEFKKNGFFYTAIDLKGYRTGSMNESLSDKEKEQGKSSPVL